MKKVLNPVISLCSGIAVFALMFLPWIDLSSIDGITVKSYTGWDLINGDSVFDNMGLYRIGAIALLIFSAILIIASLLALAKNGNSLATINKVCFGLLVVSAIIALFGVFLIVEEYIESPYLLVCSYGLGSLITVAVTAIGMIITSFTSDNK